MCTFPRASPSGGDARITPRDVSRRRIERPIANRGYKVPSAGACARARALAARETVKTSTRLLRRNMSSDDVEDDRGAISEDFVPRHVTQTLRATSPCGRYACEAGRDANVRRWDPVQQSKFLDDRAWGSVDAFHRALVRGETCVGDLNSSLRPCSIDGVPVGTGETSSRHARRPGRKTFAFRCAYRGVAFAGYAWNADVDGEKEWAFGEASVSASLQWALRDITDKGRPTPSSGRTDRGVSAGASCVSFWTRHPEVTSERIERLVNEESAPGKAGVLRVSEIREVPSSFHATFSAFRRRYVYVLPKTQKFGEERTPCAHLDGATMNRILQPLAEVDGPIDMHAFARGTPPGRSSEVNFSVARAFDARLPRVASDHPDTHAGIRRSRRDVDITVSDSTAAEDLDVVVIELEADRFLRKLARCLVATAAREAAGPPSSDDVLLRIARARDRRLAAPPAPALGLVLAGASYGARFESSRRRPPDPGTVPTSPCRLGRAEGDEPSLFPRRAFSDRATRALRDGHGVDDPELDGRDGDARRRGRDGGDGDGDGDGDDGR